MVTEKEKYTCTGCTACMNVCPKGCITMKYDKQGFLYPSIDQELCIKCGACDKVCEQTSSPLAHTSVLKGYGAISKNKENQLKSSSGGVFSLLSNSIIANHGAVVGAAMTEDNKGALHKVVFSEQEASFFRGAKYLQSNLGETFSKVDQLLKEGKEVLFSGTPCQVAGLKAYINENDDHLLCVDMVCHGVPSPMIWSKYCNEIEKAYKGVVSSVNFRYKKYSWEKPRADCRDNCTVIFRSKTEDPYMRLFLQDYTLRPSCYECQHKGMYRKSDITIADFWGVDKIAPGFSNGAGTSLVIIHTEKGRKYFERIKDQIISTEVDPQKSCEYNGAAINSAKKPARLDDFWQEQAHSTTEKLAEKYVPVGNSLKKRLKQMPVYGLLKRNKKINMENGICFIINHRQK